MGLRPTDFKSVTYTSSVIPANLIFKDRYITVYSVCFTEILI